MVSALVKIKFLVVPVKAKRRVQELTLFEVSLIEQLLSYYSGGECFEERVYIEGLVNRKASFVLVRKGLAAYVNDVLYPSEKFSSVFVPIFDEVSDRSDSHSRICSAYESFTAVP